ncbi:Hypothetical protein PHPALM_36815 [Phytophthora palmivora]|uniref:Uncharacterized protein n=1 Tax=Phytophthora palmivora TaxID=4796 RepID=A0A2P4WYZ5_9STRA|nr:Hypothetical protein PHPALM_36815 [Phytophthora palmivora]
MKHGCASCIVLQQELRKLQELSQERAKQDHEQCVAMFQQMQELVRLNEACNRSYNRPSQCDGDESASTCSSDDTSEDSAAVERARDNEQMHTHRLQMIIVQQAKELETLRRRLRSTAVDGRVMRNFGDQREGDGDRRVDLGEDVSDVEYEEHSDESAVKQYASQLRKLPLTSLHAQLKGKDLQLQRLQRIIAKLETRLGQLVDRKRSMAQSFQQTARMQQAHLKKYLAYIRQQKEEKKALERQLCELRQYVEVLEKKVINPTRE